MGKAFWILVFSNPLLLKMGANNMWVSKFRSCIVVYCTNILVQNSLIHTLVRPKILPHVPPKNFGLSAQWAQTFWKLLKKGFIRRPYSVVCTITYIMVFLSFFQDWWTMLNWQMVSSWILEEINATTVSYVSKSHPFPFDSARITKNRNEKKNNDK